MGKRYTILMTLMGLEIGGAETHVVELCKNLAKAGHRIIVASNGGVYERELSASGILHYRIPMHTRNVFQMIQAYFRLKKLIQKENIDLVHSHARIPSFICGFLHKKLGVTFVTSAHGVFYTGMGLRYLSNWGQKVIAVSEDIRRYLIKNYRVRDEDIFVTINGIDTEKFSADTDSTSVRQELGIKDHERVLVYVSRMDEETTLVARQLLELAPRLAEAIPEIRLVLVGGGNVLVSLRQRAKQINQQIGRPVALLTGGRTDVNALLAMGEVFVGVSRAALEAMAEAKPVILAGNEGYIGLFGAERLRVSQDTNFCCRGQAASTMEALFDDIKEVLLERTDQERRALGEYGRALVLAEYSVARMASDCEAAYAAAWREMHQKQYHVLISGYYGFNNSGDEAILLSMHKNIQSLGENYHITVLSNQPEETRAKYQMQVVYRFSLREVVQVLRKSDVLLSGGGSLLQDSTSTRSLMYYLSIILAAKVLRKRVMLYANGIGPVSGKHNRRIVKLVVNQADLITLREENSYGELMSMGVDPKKCFVTADPVFTMEGIGKERGRRLLREAGVPEDKPLVGVSVRNWRNIEGFVERLAALCDSIYEKHQRNIVFIVMQVPNDIQISERVQQCMQHPSYIMKACYAPDEIMGMISCMDFILSMRLHTLIFAARQRVPLIGFVYDPKIAYYLEKLQMPSGGEIQQFDLQKTLALVEDVIQNRAAYVETLSKEADRLEVAAHNNERYLQVLLKGRGERK